MEQLPDKKTEQPKPLKQRSLFGLLRPYSFLVGLLVALTVVSNTLNLVVPKLIARAIDTYTLGSFQMSHLVTQFLIVTILIFLFTYLQNIVQVVASERVARDLRNQLSERISVQTYAFVEGVTPAKLLTNLTSDVDAVKTFVSQAIASIISSVFLIIGASVLLLLINWKLALATLVIIPLIGGTFYYVLGKVRKLFKKAQEAIDRLNSVINESILGSSLIRLLNSQQSEYQKFIRANAEARTISLSILRLFASLIPVITFCTNLATLVILMLGGSFVIGGTMSLGEFTAFNSYIAILIFPILIIGFMSNVLAQASASYARISEVLLAPDENKEGGIIADIKGDVAVKGVSVRYGEKLILKDISFNVSAGQKIAIIGPTGGGKTQLLYLLTGLLAPSEGVISYDGKPIDAYNKTSLHRQIGFVFQDSVLFNLSLRENIAFSNIAKNEDIALAVATAELSDFVDTLPEKLDTVVSERGTSLSGGQKQRIMLARALALNPKVLLLDDFTARVDIETEQKILSNVAKNYPHITLISVTQRVATVAQYDQIILLMEGEILAKGTHEELAQSSPEYVQIQDSQRSTSLYEL